MNEKITLLALRASLHTFHQGKKPEDLIKVMEEIRGLSAQVNQILLPLAEGRDLSRVPPPTVAAAIADPCVETAKNPPWDASLEKWSTLLTALESAGPAIDRLKGAAAEQQGFGEKLLEDLTRILTQCQGLMSLFRDQAWAAGPSPALFGRAADGPTAAKDRRISGDPTAGIKPRPAKRLVAGQTPPKDLSGGRTGGLSEPFPVNWKRCGNSSTLRAMNY